MLQKKVIVLDTCSRDRRVGAESRTRVRQHRGEPETCRWKAREEEEGVMKSSAKGRTASSEGREMSQETRELRWRLNQLDKDKLKLSERHNKEVCFLQAEVTRFRSSLERSEAQRTKLQFQLAASQRESSRVGELQRDGAALREKSEELQQVGAELRKTLQLCQEARQNDRQALQREVEERDQLIQNFSSDNKRLHQLLQDQQAAVEATERKMADLLRERQKEAEESSRLAEELKRLEERSGREKEIADEKVKHLEAERTAHLETRSNLELQVRDLKAAVAVEQSGHKEAQCNLELLHTHFRELEKAYSLGRERRSHTEQALERLQTEFNHYQTEMAVALETERKATSDLSKKLEEEKSQLGKTESLLQQAAAQHSEAEDAFHSFLQQIIALLSITAQNPTQPAKHDGKLSPTEVLQLLAFTLSTKQHRLEEATVQVQDLLAATQKLHKENQLLQQLISDQQKQADEAQKMLQDKASDWTVQKTALQEELKSVKEASRKEIQELREELSKESADRLAFLHRLNQRQLTGRVLIQPPHRTLGDFTWRELCDVIGEQVDQVTSDLHQAKDKIAHLQCVCEKKSVCVRELKRSQECVLSSLQENMKKREETWSQQHTHTVNQLQSQLQECRSECSAHSERVSSLERRCSSLTSDLCRSRRESSSLLAACALLAGALRHAGGRLRSLSEQKAVLGRRLAEREQLELEVRKLAEALGGERTEEEERAARGRRARRRWRSGAAAVMAANRWTALGKASEVVLRLERSGGCVCVCRAPRTAALKGPEAPAGVFSRWLHSKSLSAVILSSLADLQGALADSSSSPAHVMAAARAGFSRLLDKLLDRSAASVSSGPAEWAAAPSSVKTLVSGLQQHFLLFSQRLHSAEVERRSLRLEASNLRTELVLTVPTDRFQSACEELRLSLNREQEAQQLIQEQARQLQQLQQRVDRLASEQQASTHSKQLSRKENSLRILGKQLAGVQKEKRQLEQQLQRAEEHLMEAARRQQFVVRCLKAAEWSCKQVRESLASTQRRPLLFPMEYLNVSEEKHLTGAPEVAACQSFLSVVSQLHQACCCRMDWLEQEVSAHHSHVTALRGELQDACLRQNLAFIPVDDLPGPEDDEEKPDFVPLSGYSERPNREEDATRQF